MKYLQSVRTKNPESQCIQGQNFRQAMDLLFCNLDSEKV